MKEQNICFIVEDLLPSYREKVTNDTTNQMIEEHLRKCKKCQKKYQEQLADAEQEKTREAEISRGIYRKLKRYRYQLMGMFLGIVLTIIVLMGGVAFFCIYLQNKNIAEGSTESITDYGEFENYYGISELSLFPKENDMSAEKTEINDYFYDCHGSKAYQTCQIYLECRYSEERYQKEKARLLKVTNEKTKKSAKYDETSFSYPAVYAMLNSESCYEYVLFLEEEQKMVYIYLQGMVDRRELSFDEKYLPLEYGQNGTSFEEKTEYNMYPIQEPFAQTEG